MPLEPDQMLSHYRLGEKIGEGGMGAVWKARDTTLDREVAIKLLPDGLASDGERLARFEREAKLLASLNHPNIATLHGLHEADGLRFLSMELVPGEDLSKRLTRGKLALDEALTLARQIAGALEAAHAAGIIHRDLKPANIQITPDGNVRVLDFGLAKELGTPLDAADSDDVVTVTSVGTVAGTVLGTAEYMSPEQARGLPVDRRTDLWAFGCVLYEMLTRSRPFVGRTVTDTLASVIEREPDWSALPAATPPAIRRLLRRCLQKQQERRLRDIADARLEIDDALEPDEVERPSPSSVEADTIASASSWSRRALPWLAVGVLLGLTIGWVLVSSSGSPRIETGTHAVMRFAVQASQGAGDISSFAPASDDSYVVYSGILAGANHLFLHDFDSGDVQPLAGTKGATIPFLSPDGRWVGFYRGTELMKLRRAGGDAVKICDVPAFFPGATWGPDGTILFPRGWLQGLWRVSADGGEPTLLTTMNAGAGEKGHWWPKFLPDGRHALFTIWNAGAGLIDSEIALLDVETGEYRKLFRGANAEFLYPGHIVYYHAGSYHAIAFDPDTLEVAGDPVPVLEDATDPLPHGTLDIRLAISGRGTLFYSARQIHPPVRLAMVEPGATPQLLAFPTRSTVDIAPSPNGRTIATSSLESGVWLIRLLDLQNGTDERVDLVGSSRNPFWKPDGSGFAFNSMRKGDFDLYFKDVRTGGPEQPIRITPTDETPRGWSADGTEIFIRETQPDGGMWIKAVPADGMSDDSIVLGEFQTEVLMASPDGRWLAYNSPRAGEDNIYVRPYRGPGAEVRVSPEGGRQPAWSPDGTELYYARGDSIVVVSYTVQQGRFQPGNEEVLFESPLLAQNASRQLGVLGHRRFVVGLLEEEPGRPSLNVVLNWSREVAGRLAAESD